jgi:hypothetical protein
MYNKMCWVRSAWKEESTMNDQQFINLISITSTDFSKMENESALDIIGMLIDLSYDYSEQTGFQKAYDLINDLRQRELTSCQTANLHYLEANYWNGISLVNTLDQDNPWEWHQIVLEKELICLRKAMLIAEEERNMQNERVCQIYTNLANVMNQVGRYAEAPFYWRKALKRKRDFSMAIGNYGYGLFHYSKVLYDDGHRDVFLHQAYQKLKASLDYELDGNANQEFLKYLNVIEHTIEVDYLEKELDLSGYSMGVDEAEVNYRKWCLRHSLFLNPLNDLGEHSIANRDILTCPSMRVKVGKEGPIYHGFYNALKQEYVYSRWLAYEGMNISKGSTHLSDKDVYLYNTLDYPVYGFSSQQTATAYRIAYSIFDKIAYLLNDYLELNIPQHKVNFRTLWFKELKQSLGLRAEFMSRQNWSFRGLFWLSKDLFYKDPEYREAIDPNSRGMNEMRNHLEHKYVKVHEYFIRRPDGNYHDAFEDLLAYSVSRDQFEKMTMNILRLARAALIYLSLGIYEEELQKCRQSSKMILPLHLGEYDDDWKR